MSISKKENFEENAQTLAEFAKALGHPARIAICEFLAKNDVCFSGDIANEIPLGRSTVTQHLNELKSAGLIQGTVNGKNVCYCINPAKWIAAQKLMNDLFKQTATIKIIQC